MKVYERRKKYPRRMLDANIATDYTKVPLRIFYKNCSSKRLNIGLKLVFGFKIIAQT